MKWCRLIVKWRESSGCHFGMVKFFATEKCYSHIDEQAFLETMQSEIVYKGVVVLGFGK